MSFLERIRSEAAARAGTSLRGLAASATSYAGGSLTEQARSAVTSDVLAPLNTRNLTPGLVADAVYNKDPASLIQGTAAARLTEEVGARIQRAKDFVKPFRGQKSSGTEPLPHGLGVSRLWGGLSWDEYRANFLRAASVKRSWKNLFYVQVRDLKPTRYTADVQSDGYINMLALDVSLSPYTMPGEAVQIGSANMDKLASSDRVEIRMTTMDDENGTMKRWFMSKCDQAVHTDGTFGLPRDYLMSLTLTHMASARTDKGDPRLSQKFLVRPANIENELSRRAPELEELQLSFVQFDTFMEVP